MRFWEPELQRQDAGLCTKAEEGQEEDGIPQRQRKRCGGRMQRAKAESYIANTAGWMTAEIGRQPWLVYRLMRTAAGTSPRVSAGNGLFSLLGFMGLYALLSMAFLLLMARVIARGFAQSPTDDAAPAPGDAAAPLREAAE